MIEISRVNEHVMFNNVGSINDSRINVKKCASRNGLKLRSANTAKSMRCNTAVQDRGRWLRGETLNYKIAQNGCYG